MDPRVAREMLTQNEVRFFKEEGYLIKRGLIPQERVEVALETVWSAGSKPPSIIRGVPETYGTDEAKAAGWAARDIGADMLSFVPGKPFESEVWKIAEQLLGPDLIMPDPTLPARPTTSGGARACGRRTRGVYNTLPRNEPKPHGFFPGGCHQEGHPFQLGVVAYVAPVVPDGGGFHVWPRSHRMLWKTLLKEYSSPGDGKGGTDTGPDMKLLNYEQTMDVIRAQQPVEFTGVGGDVLFWHHRLCQYTQRSHLQPPFISSKACVADAHRYAGHAAGQNFSPNIRMSCLYDFAQRRMNLSDEDGHLVPGGELDRAPGDMWRDWSAFVQNAGGAAGPIEMPTPQKERNSNAKL